MTVTVRLYAGLQAYGPDGTRVLVVEVPEGLTIDGLIPRLGIPPDTVRRVFVNGIIREESYVLQPGDEVGVFPPIAGSGHVQEFLHIRSVADARARFVAAWSPGPPRTEAIALAQAYRRVLGQDVPAPEDLPPHPRSVVDGYAVRAADTFGASEGLPAYLAVTGEVLMGQAPGHAIGLGEAVRIPTGGVLPPGADAVVMVEHTETLPGGPPAAGAGSSPAVPLEGVEVRRPVAPGENVIQPGEDICREDVVLRAGTVLRPPHIGLLAGLGVIQVCAAVPPRVAILSTGDEVVPPERTPAAGQVRDINGPALCAAVQAEGAQPVFSGIVPDRFDALLAAMRAAKESSDLVLVSGGSSIGPRDEVSRAIDALGPPGVLVHGVAMKPGKPAVLGLCGGTPVVGLPGHPTTVLVVFHVFVREIIGRLLGRAPGPAAVVQARLTRRVASAAGRTDYLRVRLERRDGLLWATPILGKSGLISTMAAADGRAVVPEAV
ncbi:MAG TPA: gephyrin-like molybdotransferase Glp, partial [bacterium]|nr:gephyrin-like molybdotransferase Glp [bacterium]